MSKIMSIKAIQVLDSRGNPTLKVVVKTEKESGQGWAFVPSGASTGIHEAWELRDGGKIFNGKGVSKAVDNVNKKISKRIKGISVFDQEKIDIALKNLDGTENKKKIGANAILGVSLAVSRAAAACKGLELYEYLAELSENKKKPMLPVPLANVLNGGKHAGNLLKFQEFMIIPTKAKNFSDATRMVAETYSVLKELIDEKYGKTAVNVGDEGGFAPPIRTPEEALDLISNAIAKAGYKRKLRIGIDVAASEFFVRGDYDIGAKFTWRNLLNYYDRLLTKYDIKSIEDPFEQDDKKAWEEMMITVAKKRRTQIVGDDLTVSSPSRVRMAASNNLCNCLLLKPNQIGTLTETLKAVSLAKEFEWEIIVSHRSGDTEDPYIVDLAVGIGATQVKIGAPCRGERTAKYNRLLEIEAGLKRKDYAGKKLNF